MRCGWIEKLVDPKGSLIFLFWIDVLGYRVFFQPFPRRLLANFRLNPVLKAKMSRSGLPDHNQAQLHAYYRLTRRYIELLLRIPRMAFNHNTRLPGWQPCPCQIYIFVAIGRPAKLLRVTYQAHFTVRQPLKDP